MVVGQGGLHGLNGRHAADRAALLPDMTCCVNTGMSPSVRKVSQATQPILSPYRPSQELRPSCCSPFETTSVYRRMAPDALERAGGRRQALLQPTNIATGYSVIVLAPYSATGR